MLANLFQPLRILCMILLPFPNPLQLLVLIPPLSQSTIFSLIHSLPLYFSFLHWFPAAVRSLEREGKLSLDDTIDIHLPELKEVGKHITIKQLLSHCSGLPYIWSKRFYGKGLPAISDSPSHPRMDCLREILELYSDYIAAAPPRGGGYSNIGYAILGNHLMNMIEPYIDRYEILNCCMHFPNYQER